MGVVAFTTIEGKRKPDPVLGSDAIPLKYHPDIQRFRQGYAKLWKTNPGLARFVLHWTLALLQQQGCLPPPS